MRASLLRNLMLPMLLFATSFPAQAGTAFSLKDGRGVGGEYGGRSAGVVPPFRGGRGDQHPSPGGGGDGRPPRGGGGDVQPPRGGGGDGPPRSGGGDGPPRGRCLDGDWRGLRCDRPQPPVLFPPQPPVVFHPPPSVVFRPQPPVIFRPPNGSNPVSTGLSVAGRPAASTIGPIAILMALLGAGLLIWRWRRRTQKKSHDLWTHLVGVSDFGQQSISFLGSLTDVGGSPVTITRSRDLKPALLSSASMKGA